MGKGVVCRQCTIISRGIVGNCAHVEEEVLEAIAVERRQFQPLIELLTRESCMCLTGHRPCAHTRARGLQERLNWPTDPANSIYEFPDDFNASLMPAGFCVAPIQYWPNGPVATFDDTENEFVLFSRAFRKSAENITLCLQGEPSAWPGLKRTCVEFQLLWREVRDDETGRMVGSLHEAGHLRHTFETRKVGPDLPYLWSPKFKIPMPIQAGMRYDLILGRTPRVHTDTLIGNFQLARVRVEED